MQGICVYQRDGRPTWYVAYDCPKRARRVFESTGINLTDPRGKLAAYEFARSRSLSGITHGQGRDESQWANWVEPWLRMRFAHQAKTLTNHLGAWKFLRAFLHEAKVFTPRALTYQHAVAFVLAREQQVKLSGRKVSRNTALHNIKSLSRIMREAVRRGFATANPCVKITEDVPRDPVAEKPEFTDEQIARVRKALARRMGRGEPEDWMPIAFEIALHQTCRFAATQIPMERIDFERDTIQFHEKGGKVFTLPMHPALKPLLLRLRDEGRKITCTLPWHPSREFAKVMKRLGLPHTFHCTRVTGITRMARAGIPVQQAMAAVHHGSWTVHRIYQRLNAADLRGVHAALAFPGGAASGSPQIPGGHPATLKPLPGSSSGRKKSGLPSPALRAAG